MNMLKALLFATVLHTITTLARSTPTKCTIAESFDINMCYKDPVQLHEVACNEEVDVCKKGFNVSHIKLEPFTLNHLFIKSIVTACCGSCAKVRLVSTFESISEFRKHAVNSTVDVLWPVMGRTTAVNLYGFNFLPVLDVSTAYYVTKRNNDMLTNLILSCLDLYPLVVIGLLLAVVSGFLAWLMETWVNRDQFPRPFLIGWFEGFWWSFISMTTVGYGDKAPKSIAARLYSVIWILVGITVFNMITASLTNTIQTVTSPPLPVMTEANVGGLHHRVFEASLVAQHGGIFNQTYHEDFTTAIFDLIRRLQDNKIDGFILDKYSYMYAYYILDDFNRNHMNNITSIQKDDIAFFFTKTIRTEKRFDGAELSYGMLLRRESDYEYFKPYVMDNRFYLQTCDNLALNFMAKNIKVVKEPLFSVYNNDFQISVIVVCSIIVMICCFGVVFEWRRKNYTSCKLISNMEIVTHGE